MAATACEHHSGLETSILNLKESDQKQWDAIEKLQNRIPVWATLFISALTFLCGASMTYAALAVRMAQTH